MLDLSVMSTVTAESSETIYIRADGSLDPSTAPIQRNRDTYTFTENITGSITIERDNITINGATHTLQGRGVNTGFYLSNRTNVTIQQTSVVGFQHGIELNYSSNNNITTNILLNNSIGIFATGAMGNTFSDNNIANSSECGILLDYNSQQNTVMSNEITNNNRGIRLNASSKNKIVRNNIIDNIDGIFLKDSTENIVYQNSVVRNTLGLCLGSSILTYENNTFHQNNFGENEVQVQIGANSSHNRWDNGYPAGGNYWSDFNGTDIHSGQFQNETNSDRIGDTPYVIDTENHDGYPLIYPYGFVPSPDLTGDGEVDIRDVSVAALAFGTYPCHPNWKFEADMNQDSQIDIRDLVIIVKKFGENILIQDVSIRTDKSEYAHLESVKITVSYRTQATQVRNVVLAATIEDDLNVHVGITMHNLTVGGSIFNQFKKYTSTLTITIPYWASAGPAMVHVNFLKKLTSTGPYLSLTAEATLSVQILSA
jgi:parallel beta-helix repeat protein